MVMGGEYRSCVYLDSIIMILTHIMLCVNQTGQISQ